MDGQLNNTKPLVVVGKNVKEIKQMASVVGKTIFSDGKGKLFFGYYKTDDAVEFVDYKTWKKLSFKDVSKGDTNKERVIKAILKNQKQFNKKVDFNMWAKKQKRSFEDTMDWFIQNGWINNINKGGIKESVDVLSVNEDIEPQTKKIAYYTGTRPEAVKDFVSKHGLNITKLLKYVEKGKLPQRMELVSALAGRPNNPTQKKIIKMFGESVKEAKFGYKDSTASYIKNHNNEYKVAEKLNKGE
jgi:ribosomal protein L10